MICLFDVEYYEKDDGTYPAEEFILSQDMKMQAKLFHLLELLELKGNELREPYSKPLSDGICDSGKQHNKSFIFFCDRQKNHTHERICEKDAENS